MSWTIRHVEVPQELARAADVRLGGGRVLADHVERGQLAVLHRLEHLASGASRTSRITGTPHDRLEPRAGLGVVLDVLEARQLVGDRAHVAAALHVVLAAQRVEAAPVPADVPAEQPQVDQRQHVVDGVVVLGDAERPADLGAVGPRVGVRELADHLGGDPGRLLARARASTPSPSPGTRRTASSPAR